MSLLREIKAKTDSTDTAIRGNGKPGIHQRLDQLEWWRRQDTAGKRRGESRLWRIVEPALPIVYGLAFAYLLRRLGM